MVPELAWTLPSTSPFADAKQTTAALDELVGRVQAARGECWANSEDMPPLGLDESPWLGVVNRTWVGDRVGVAMPDSGRSWAVVAARLPQRTRASDFLSLCLPDRKRSSWALCPGNLGAVGRAQACCGLVPGLHWRGGGSKARRLYQLSKQISKSRNVIHRPISKSESCDDAHATLTKKFVSPSSGSTVPCFKMPSPTLHLSLSAVAGLSSTNGSAIPLSFLALTSASLSAKRTVAPKNKGGSPTPLEDWILRRPCQAFSPSLGSCRKETLNSCGMSEKPGIL